MTETASRTNYASIVVRDRGTGARLDGAGRKELTSWLRQAGRDRAAAALLHVEGDAFAHHGPAAGRVEAAAIGGGPHALLRAVEAAAFPVVVHAEGEVSELGLALLLAADVVVLGGGASLIFEGSSPHALLAAGLPSIIRHRAVPASDLLWTGRTLTAAEAASRGLVSEVGDVDRAEELADRIARDAAQASVLRRSLRADQAAQLARRLEYDAWLAVAAGTDQ